jgi:hypothetical protein
MGKHISDLDLSSEVSTMGHAPREPKRRLQLIIAMVAMMGMELDVLWKPFSPLQLLRWLQPSDPDETNANRFAGAQAQGSAGSDSLAERATPNGQQADQTKGRPKLGKLPVTHDLIAVRSKTRSSSLPLFCHCSLPVRSLDMSISRYGHDRHLHHPSGISLLQQICRMLC